MSKHHWPISRHLPSSWYPKTSKSQALRNWMCPRPALLAALPVLPAAQAAPAVATPPPPAAWVVLRILCKRPQWRWQFGFGRVGGSRIEDGICMHLWDLCGVVCFMVDVSFLNFMRSLWILEESNQDVLCVSSEGREKRLWAWKQVVFGHPLVIMEMANPALVGCCSSERRWFFKFPMFDS